MSVITKFVNVDQKSLNSQGYIVIDTTSRNPDPFWHLLSPFYLTHPLYPSVLFENFWQYSKFYPSHHGKLVLTRKNRTFEVPFRDEYVTLPEIEITDEFLEQAKAGFGRTYADRYPYGKGAKPACSVIQHSDGRYYALDYIHARKLIYAPYYAIAVAKTEPYQTLKRMADSGQNLALLDFDAVDFSKGFEYVLNDPHHKMGHSAVLAAMLTGQYTPDAIFG